MKKENLELREILLQENHKKHLQEVKNRNKKEEDNVENAINDDNKKYAINRKTLGEKTKELKQALNAKKSYIATALGAVALTSVIFLTANGCQKENKENKENDIITTSITTETEETIIEETIQLEDEIELETAPFVTTAPKETTTSVTTTPKATLSATSKVEETTKPIIAAEDIIVTKAPVETKAPVTTTIPQTLAETTKPITTTKVAETTKPITTTKVAETTKSVQTAPTTTATNVTTQPIEIKPIQVKNLSKKADILKDYALLSGYAVTDDLAINTIRVLHSDYIEHDGYKEITAQDYDAILRLLTNIGGTHETLMNLSYLTGQIELNGYFYLPAEIFPEDQQAYMKEFNNLTQSYVNSLNKYMYVPGELDYEEIIRESKEQNQKYLDTYQDNTTDENYAQGVISFDEYIRLLKKSINNDVLEEEEKFQLAEQIESNRLQNERTKAYMEYLEKVTKLVNKKEYANMHSAKLGILVNVTPGLLSGIDNKNYGKVAEKVQNISETIISSVDDIRETMIVSNRINNRNNENQKIDQKEVLEAYIKEATTRNEEESQLFSDVFDNIKAMATSYVKTR